MHCCDVIVGQGEKRGLDNHSDDEGDPHRRTLALDGNDWSFVRGRVWRMGHCKDKPGCIKTDLQSSYSHTHQHSPRETATEPHMSTQAPANDQYPSPLSCFQRPGAGLCLATLNIVGSV